MTIRKYKPSDCAEISELFYETVHTVNKRDYTEEQLSAWAENRDCLLAKNEILMRQNTLVAEADGRIVGFGSIDESGYLDFLFVNKCWQNKGVATLLCDELEKPFDIITTYSSVTARSFFTRRGYETLREQEVERAGIKLKRFEMRKKK